MGPFAVIHTTAVQLEDFVTSVKCLQINSYFYIRYKLLYVFDTLQISVCLCGAFGVHTEICDCGPVCVYCWSRQVAVDTFLSLCSKAGR